MFTPDQPVTELVFRLWPNGLEHLLGGSLSVTRAQVSGHDVARHLASAGGRSGTPGTLLTLPLGKTVDAGQTITADLDFTLNLPPAFVDRLGSDGRTAWWGSAAPLLAWVRGSGWARSPGAAVQAESAVSEAAQTDVSVTAPTADSVLANGTAAPPVAVSPTERRWRFTAPTARDVAVAVGRFREVAAAVPTSAGAVPVRIGTAPGIEVSPEEILQQLKRVLPLEVRHFGRYPFEQLTVAVLPKLEGTGIEYPGMFLLGDGGDPSITDHELAHMWFYGLVGNDQLRHPWLDESLATAAEQIVDAEIFGETPAVSPDGQRLFADPRPVDSASSAFSRSDQDGYVKIVYFKGAAALLTARQQVGAAKFDAALRCYVNANAWRVAVPADFATAFRDLPAAVAVLRKAGAVR